MYIYSEQNVKNYARATLLQALIVAVNGQLKSCTKNADCAGIILKSSQLTS